MLLRQVVLAGEACRGVAGVHGAVAVAELGALAGGAALGVGLADHDRLLLQLGEGRDDRHGPVDHLQLARDPHLHVAVEESRRALGVEGDEVDGGALPARGVVGTVQAVVEEIAQERIVPARGVWPPHPRRGQGAPHRVDRVVVELVELLGSPLPVVDVGLVPDLPVPALHLGLAVLQGAVLDPPVDQLGPPGVVLRRMGPAGVDVVVGQTRAPLVLVRLRLDGERLGHEADLRVGLEPPLQVGVEDAVHDRPVVDRLPLGVLGVRVRAPPLEGGRSVPGVEEVVGAEVHLGRPEPAQRREQLPAVLHVRVVRLVRPEEPPDRMQVPAARPGIDLDRDRERVARPRAGARRQAEKDGDHQASDHGPASDHALASVERHLRS